MAADIYLQIAKDYKDSPDLRLTWLDNLAVIHVQNSNIVEAAQVCFQGSWITFQCKIHIAYLITLYLQRVNPRQLPLEIRDRNCLPFRRISPNIDKEDPISDDVFVSLVWDVVMTLQEHEGRFQSEMWSLVSLTKVLKEAITLLERVEKW